jgi:hypothetical protein
MKKIILWVGGIIVAVVIIGLVGIFISLDSIVKKGVNTFGPKLTKVDTRLDGAKVSPLSGKGQLTGFFLGNPAGFKTPSAIKVGDIKVGIQPSSVFADVIVIDEVNVQAPDITLEGSIMSGNNLSKILDNLNSAAGTNASAKPATPAGQKAEKKFIVKDLLINGGKIHLSVTELRASVPLPLPEIHVQNIGAKENGVTAAEMSKQIMEQLLVNVLKTAKSSLASMGKEAGKEVKEIGKGALDQVDKTADQLKGLFK